MKNTGRQPCHSSQRLGNANYTELNCSTTKGTSRVDLQISQWRSNNALKDGWRTASWKPCAFKRQIFKRDRPEKVSGYERPSINTPNDILLSHYAQGKGWKANFEYFMNREYAYNRDKGKCKCCGRYFSETVSKHCHHVNNMLPIEKINKVPNLAWLCIPCHRMVHNSPIPPELDPKTVRKIQKYRDKLKAWNL